MIEHELERMIVRLVGDQSSYQRMLKEASTGTVETAQDIEQTLGRVDQASLRLDQLGAKFTQVGGGLTVLGGVATAAFGAMTWGALNAAAQYQQTEIAFSTMMGSVEAAQKTLTDLTQFAAATPFQMPEIEQVARGLIMFGESGDRMMETLRILGDAASGTGANFGELGLIFNQVRGVGKLLTQDFRQLSTRGVISLQDIADHYKVTTAEAQNMLSAGKISFEDLRTMLKNLTSDSGRFANMMEKQSQSLSGLRSTLADNLGILMRDIGTELVPLMSKVTEFAIHVTGMFSELGDGTKSFIAYSLLAGTAVGALVTATGGVVIVAGQAVIAYGALTKALAASTIATKAQTMAFTSASVAAKAVPYLAAAAAIAYVSREIYRANPAIRDFNAAMAERNRLMGEISGVAQRRQAAVFDAASTLEGAEAVKYLEEQLALAEKEMQGFSTRSKLAKEEADRLEPTWLSLGQAGRKVWEVQIAEYNEMRQRYGEASDYVRQLQAEIERAQQTIEGAPIEALDNLTAKLKEQLATVGMSADEIERYRLSQLGANNEQLRGVAVLQQQLAARQAQAGLRSDVDELVASLERQIRTVGMSAEQIQLLDLRARGLSEAWIEMIGVLQQQVAIRRQQEAYVELRKSMAETLQGYRDQILLIGQSAAVTELFQMARQGANQTELEAAAAYMRQRDALTQQNELLNRAKDLMKENLTPQQKYAAGMRELNSMLRVAGRDFYPAYLQEAQKLREEFEQNEVTKITAEFEILGLDAVRAGSKEFLQLQRESANFQMEQKVAEDVRERTQGAIQPRPEHGGIRSDPASRDPAIAFLERIARGVEAQAGRPEPQIASVIQAG